jgi:hypothetical protein
VTISAHPGRLLWHHEVHIDWGQTVLEFWFISFRHSYDPDEVLPFLHEVAIEMGLSAYTSYELLGPYDVLLRMYIPIGGEQPLRDAVENRLHRHDLKIINRFKADDIARHWPWATNENGSGAMRRPTKTTMKKRRPAREISIINEIGRLAEKPETVTLNATDADLLNTYVADKLVTFATRNQGIRLVTSVNHPDNLEHDALRNLARQLSRALDAAAPLIQECSLYRGEPGQHMVFLLMYRVSFEHFHVIRREFLQNIREIVGAANASTMTSVIVSDDVRCFADSLLEEIDEESQRDFLELLSADESRDFEAKGSALAPVRPWLYEDKPLEEDSTFFRETILKTIAGFLNSRGGTLVVGAVETDDYNGRATKKLDEYPKVGPHTCLGLVDPSFVRKGWDEYLRHCSGLIAKGIEPSPGLFVEIDIKHLAEVPLMLITVEEPADDQEYYVVENDKTAIFYARRDNSTIPLHGEETKRHMKQVSQRRSRRRARMTSRTRPPS